MSNAAVEYTEDAGIAFLTLNRPEVLNSLNKALAKALIGHIEQAEKNTSVRAILLTGNGKGFCAGQDLAELQDPNTEVERIVVDHCNVIATKILTCPLPIVCAVNGVAAGAGANIALCCDIVLASEQAKFIQAFINVGLIPDTAGTYILPRLIGDARARALSMLGTPVSASDAETMGMIYKSCSQESLLEEALTITKHLSQLPTQAIAAIKKSLLLSSNNNLSEQLTVEAELQATLAKTKDYQEGVQAFIEKRKAKFTGA